MKSPIELKSELVSPTLVRRRRRRWLGLLGLGAAAVAALTFTSLRPEPTPPLIDVARVEAPEPQIPAAAIPEAETVAEAETLAETATTETEEGVVVAEGAAASHGQVMRLPPVYITVSVGKKAGATTDNPPESATETGHE